MYRSSVEDGLRAGLAVPWPRGMGPCCGPAREGGVVPADRYEWAFRAWPVLTERARQRSVITYGELGEALHIHHRTVRLVLEIIQDFCLREPLPPLTILVVKMDGNRPGAGVSPARTITCQRDKLPGHKWTPADQHAAADLDGQPVRLPGDRCLWPDAEALAYRNGRRPGATTADGRAGTGQRQDVRAGRDGYAADRDLTVNVYSSPESPDTTAGLHEPSGGVPPAGVEVIVRRRFAMDWENGYPRLAGAQAIVANNSAASVILTKVGLKPVGFPGPSKLISGNIPEKVEPGSAVTCALQVFDFSDIWTRCPSPKWPGDPVSSFTPKPVTGPR
jgi:hypothetical protein